MIGTDTLDAAVLPLLGFSTDEMVAGSTTAAMCSAINNIVAGSLFATLQSLEAYGLYIILFGAVDSALALLGSLAARLDWCNGSCSSESTLSFETIDGNCENGCMARFRLTVKNIENLISVRSPEFKLGSIMWSIIVFKNYPNFGIYLHGNKPCNSKMAVQLISSHENMQTVQRQQNQNIRAHGGLCMNDFILWDELLKIENKFVQNHCITIEVEVKVDTSTMTDLDPIKLKCAVCNEGIVSQEISSVPCGHLFCTKCIEYSLSECECCPICKKPATLNDLRRIILPKYTE